MKNRLRAEFFLLICTVIWGGSFIAIKLSLADLSPFMLVAIRFGISALLYFPLFLVNFSQRPVRSDPSQRDDRITSLIAGSLLGVMMFLGYGLQTVGLSWTTPAKSAFITETLIVITPFLHFIVFGQKPERRNLAGIIVILPGLFLLMEPDATGVNPGDVLTLLCAVSFSLYILFLDRYSRHHAIQNLLFYQMFVTSLLAFAVAFLFENNRFVPTARLLWALIYLAPIATLLALYLQNRYQKDISPVRAAILYVLEPLFAALFSTFILRERFDATAVTGGILILFGVLLSGIPWSFGRSVRTG